MENIIIQNDILEYRVNTEGIALITINMVHESTNLFSMGFVEKYIETAEQAITDNRVKGVIVTSSRKDFMAGADLKFLRNPPKDQETLLKGMLEMHRQFRIVEKGGKPFVAAINGNALGGGYELALTCHHRIAVEDSGIRIGQPEVRLGLFPGGGATQRLPRIIGLQQALTVILQAQQLRPKDAKREGLVDELVSSAEELIPAASKWILENGHAVQPWDKSPYKIPGGGIMSPNGFQVMVGGIGNLRKRTHGNYPGAQYAMAAIHDGLQLPLDKGLEVEARYFIKAISSKEAQNLIRTGFFFVNEAKKGKAKPAGFDFFRVKKIGILGAGMMGAGIAYVSAMAGMQVILKDISLEQAEKGKQYSVDLLADRLRKGRMSENEMKKILDRIHPTADPNAIQGCDLVIEAVFEDPRLKAQVTKETEAVLKPGKIFASNTSTLPITVLAGASKRPEQFIGIHFFSPVDKMPLVEIIVGEKTSDRTIAAAIDYATQIGKVPIVVNDSHGFFTSRVFGTFTGEGALLLEEGVPPALIENTAKRIGMPVGPLAVTDEVSLTLGLHVMDQIRNKPPHVQRVYNLYTTMVKDHGREGKKTGKGFYNYPAGDKKHLWRGLTDIFPVRPDHPDAETVGKRLLHIMALESYRCLEEGVLRDIKDGDVGSLLGFGFPPYTGGVFSYIDYVGVEKFVDECDDFAQRFGPRFLVPESLRTMVGQGKTFY